MLDQTATKTSRFGRRDFHKGALAMGLIGSNWPANAQSATTFLPDESAPHERSFMQWPNHKSVYPNSSHRAQVQACIAKIANHIAEFEPVVMLMPASEMENARAQLSNRIEIWDVPTDDLWARDSGPIFVQDQGGNSQVLSLNFNGWGGKQPHPNDAKIAANIAARMGLPLINSGLVGELGGIERAPDGVLLANRSSWVNKNRNTILESEIAEKLMTYLGASQIIWADGVRGLDITDDHIDATARFTSSEDIVIQLPPKSRDPFAKAAWNCYEILRESRNASGAPYRLHVIDEPENPRMKSRDFVASYVNYYLCNGALIMPQFGDARADHAARETLASLYPNREIVALDIDALGELGGGIHCATMQQPKRAT